MRGHILLEAGRLPRWYCSTDCWAAAQIECAFDDMRETHSWDIDELEYIEAGNHGWRK